MATEGRTLMSAAISDANELKEAAMEAAKQQLIEELTPAVRSFVEERLKRKTRVSEDSDRLRRGIEDNAPGESHTGFEESAEKGDTKMGSKGKDAAADVDEGLGGYFPAMSEEEETKDDGPSMEDEGMGIPSLGEGEDRDAKDEVYEKKEKKDEDGLDEEIEISEAQLMKIYNESLQTEASVTKSFGDMTKSGELDEVDPGAGIVDVKKGEHDWEKETPPAKQDFTVKEVRTLIARGIQENKFLRSQLGTARKIIEKLGTQLHEVNLFNSKVLHVNKIFNGRTKLTREQRDVVIESLDKASTIKEVKLVYESIIKSFKSSSTKSLSEGRRVPSVNAQRFRAKSSPDPKVLSESVDRETNEAFLRLQQLAGLDANG
jgi:hypothetical protein